MEHTNTRGAAETLGISPNALYRAVWDGRLPAPQRGPSGAFIWTEADICRASMTLLHRELDDVRAERLQKEGCATPGLKLTQQEAAVRQAVKDEIAARHGFSRWDDAPNDALREYQQFLRRRTGGQP